MAFKLSVVLSFYLLGYRVKCLENCIECLVVTVGAPEQIGGPTCCDYDSPFTAIIVNSPNSNTYQQRQYSANQISYLTYNDSFLPDPVEIGLGRGPNKSDLDYCGSWLNSAINNLINDSSNIVHGFYHEEWNCNYSDNSYTNKSIAYAISTNGGLNFTKPNYPHNQIILPPPGNTTTVHQTGEGDHEVAVINDSVLYLYFTEWDVPQNTPVTIGLAKSVENGLPGTWYKYLNGKFDSPGLGGDSSAIADITGTCVRYRKVYDDFIAMGSRGNIGNTMGHGPRLSFSKDGIHDWVGMNSSLLWLDQYSWNRVPPVGELVAYPSLISRDIVADGNMHNFVYNMSYWLYYTYLEPNATFLDRYSVRRKVDIKQYDEGIPNNVAQVRVMLSHYYNDALKDSWFTTAMIPKNDSYKNMDNGNVLGLLMTMDVGNNDTTKIYDCYIEEWNDHMIGFENECDVVLRTLGWLYKNEINNEYIETQPIYRCFNDTIKNHFVSLNADCDNEGKTEFMMGQIIKA